jgi:ketosteroid isomerase-like protein
MSPDERVTAKGERMTSDSGTITQATLKSLLDAFNRHDLDAIMEYFADECVLYLPRGASPRGATFEGKAEVRRGLATRFEGLPDVHYGDDRHWVCGDFGVSEWTITGTPASGKRVEARGVDLLEFRQGKIIRKDSFWKIVE